jgi:hypothetical protein
MKQRLQEHNSYITLKANEVGIAPADLETAWDSAVSTQKIESPELPETDPMFTRKVMDKFDKQVDMIHVEKARSIIMAREESVRHGQSWVDALAQGNYVKANEVFPNFVKSSYNSIVDSKSKEFLAKFAEKLKNSNQQSK